MECGGPQGPEARAAGWAPVLPVTGGWDGARSALLGGGRLCLGGGARLAHRHADDVRVKHHGATNEALDGEDGLTAVHLARPANQHQPIARPNRTAEAHVLHAAEAEEVTVQETDYGDVVR